MSKMYTTDELAQINEDRAFWEELEHDDWELAAFTGQDRAIFQRSGTDANGSPLSESMFVRKDVMQFVARALHTMKERNRAEEAY